MKNRDNKCALWSILASLYPQAKNSDRLSKYAPYEHELNVESQESGKAVRMIVNVD